MAAKIRRDDEATMLTGKDKGKRGRVKDVLSSDRVTVKDASLVKKHRKPVPALNQPGNIVEEEAAIQISGLTVFNVVIGRTDRIGFRPEDGKRVRFFRSNSETIK